MAKKLIAFCWASGQIGFTDRRPPIGTLPISRGPARKLRARISARARHAYDGKTLLVPGIPEAQDDDARIDALHAFIERVRA
jgi:hypothetical protein